MVGHTYLDLKPLTWSQTIGHYPNSDPSKKIEGSGLSLIARATPNCDLILRNRVKLRDFDITLHIISGTLEPDEHLKYVLIGRPLVCRRSGHRLCPRMDGSSSALTIMEPFGIRSAKAGM